MLLSIPLALGLITCLFPTPAHSALTEEELQVKLETMETRIVQMTQTIKNLARQTMVQQFANEERSRGDGDSGVKVGRANNMGPQNYYTSTHINGHSFMSVHDHANYDRTMGMGEVSAVLNGVEFRTRHNDYKLKMPSTDSTDFHATQDIPFPPVPENVTDLIDVGDQIAEMREWFKAFQLQDTSIRDYRPYFRPVLCYLEGTWTLDTNLEEPFESDRHHLEAGSWFELMENVRYTAYTGSKNRLENYAYLPTGIMSVNDTTAEPNYAQWNYRIMCHPVKEDIPTSYLKQVDDLAYRFPRNKDTLDDVFLTRAARFRLFEFDSLKFEKYSMIDRLMAQIPGKDNIPSDDMKESSFGETMYKYDEDVELNAGYYHRWFKFSKPGAMGLTTVSRGFNDENCWVAMTTQNRVAPMSFEICEIKKWKKNQPEVCTSYNNRYSYAIPLEIVYLTPLLTWNPWNLATNQSKGVATADRRNGDKKKPLDGTDPSHHYITPIQFFSGSTDTSDPADTVKNANYVLDQDGVARETTASGTRIILQEIQDVGKVRLRYPIAPVHGEGSSAWKELNALRDYVFKHEATGGEGGNGPGGSEDVDEDDLPENIEFETAVTNKPTEHYHTFYVSRGDYVDMMKEPKLEIRVTTEEAAGHTHKLNIRHHAKRGWEYVRCDDQKTCWDKHNKLLIEVRDGS